ncbi:MAG: hypothetical protein GOMPHAMPRED_005078 [Gomphillus americanus]|uniref:Glutamyl-tRNA(Gln) amidotransferase subunit A, mitochondrial n=1 Tax=Gomphillus americanus TaxID=1940652 RepID=A0A8H3EL09_9LECA|nr:MAG: hypothetical protein GOMPHAMPRED_005078 [Gomphillus americanus]
MSLLAAVEASLKHGTLYKASNAFVQWTDAGYIRAAASVADKRCSTGHQLSPIDGRLIAIKDNICTTGLPTTCASNSLKGFQSPYESTVVKKLRAAGAIICGKTNLDEFGMGSHSTNSASGAVNQGTGGELSVGGSSGGSAIAVASQQCWASIGTDTGGSIRLPAAYTGTVGFKPSYGMISRHGVIAYANSLDTVGILSRSVKDVQQVFAITRGHDTWDPTSLTEETRTKLTSAAKARPRRPNLRIGVPVEYNVAEINPTIRTIWQQALERVISAGHEVVSISLPSTRLALSTYYVLAPAEASSNLAKYDGVKYGNAASKPKLEANVLFATGRGQNLGDEVKRRILLGSFTLSASAFDNYFLQAQKVRRSVQQDFNAVFGIPNVLQESSAANPEGVDLLLTPTAPSFPPKLASLAHYTPLKSYGDDVLTVPASLAGLPVISIPTRTDTFGLDTPPGSVGLQLIGQYGNDDFVLDTAGQLETLLWNR